jgi:hypothetical protein
MVPAMIMTGLGLLVMVVVMPHAHLFLLLPADALTQ